MWGGMTASAILKKKKTDEGETSTAGEEGFDALRRRADKAPAADADFGRCMREAREQQERGNREESLYQMLLAARATPDNPYPRVQAGKLCRELGWPKAARMQFDAALRNIGAIASDVRRKDFEAEVQSLVRELNG